MARLKSPPGGLMIAGKRYPSGSLVPERYRRQLEPSERPRDPGYGSDRAVPNMGRAIVPHVLTFSGLVTGLARTYRYADEALRHSVDNAHMMLNDPMIAGPLLARQHMTALLNWSVESEDDKDPKLKAVAKELTDILSRTPRFTEYRRCLLEAIWYGRYGVQNLYGFHTDRRGSRRRVVADWVPISGDKILFRFDDGSGDYDRNQIGIRVTASMASRDIVAGRRVIEPTGEGLAYFLERWERKLVALHRHYIRDGEFEDPRSGGQIHGVGLRHFLYWIWYQKQEAFAQVAEIVERTGMGFIIYFYPHGNEQARLEVEKISKEQAHTNTILMPAEQDDTYRVEQIPPNTSGLQVLIDYIENYLGDMIVRFILGQTLSTKPTGTGMNSGVADLQKDSLFHIVRYDAVNLEETLTRELLLPNRDFNFPKYRNADFWFRISTKVAAPEQELQALQQLWTMGAEIKISDIFDRMDLSMPDADDKTLFNPQVLMAAKQFKDQLRQGAAPVGGPPPGLPAPGGIPAPGGMPAPPPAGPPQQMDKEDEEREEKARLFGPIMYRRATGRAEMLADIAAAVANTDQSPSDALKEAGTYRKGRFWWRGLEIVLETPKGVRRRPEWPPMGAHYGYIRRMYSPRGGETVTTEPSKDGDHIDVFVGPDPDSEVVYCIDQTKANGRTFDEHKVMIGFRTEEQARDAYLASYQSGWNVGPVTPLTLEQFAGWLDEGDQSQPLAGQAVIKYARRASKSGFGQMSLFGGDADPEHPRAPKGGTDVAGEHYSGGEWVPKEKVEEVAEETGKSKQEVASDIAVGRDPAAEEAPVAAPELAEPEAGAVKSQIDKEADDERGRAERIERGGVRAGADVGESGGGGDLGANPARPTGGRIVVARGRHTAPADRSLVPARLQQHLDDHQQEGVAKMVASMRDNGGALCSDGTGVGKTREQLAVAQYWLDQGAKVLVVAPKQVTSADWKKGTISGSWKHDSEAMGVPVHLTRDEMDPRAVNLTSYENLSRFVDKVDKDTVLIIDESHGLKNRESDRSKFGMAMIAKAKAVMFSTATPVDKVEHLHYLDRAGVFGGRYYGKTYEQLGLELIEKKVRGGKTVKTWQIRHGVKASEVLRRMSGLFDRLTRDGKMIKREISMDGVPIGVTQIQLPQEAHDAMRRIEDAIAAKGISPGFERAQILLHQRRQQEPYKVPETLDMALEAVGKGRQVVIFASRVNKSVVGDEEDENAVQSEGTMKLLKEELIRRGVPEDKIAEIHGGVAKAKIPQNMERFQSCEAKVVIATVESGGTGINLDDVKGDAPRTLIMMTAPFSAVENVQAIGRVWRLKTKSIPDIRYLFGDTEVDDWNAALISKKMKTLGASVSGQVGRLDVKDLEPQEEKDAIDYEPEEPYEWKYPGEGEQVVASFAKLDDGGWGLRFEGSLKPGDEVEVQRRDGSRERKFVGEIVKSGKGYTIARIGAAKPRPEKRPVAERPVDTPAPVPRATQTFSAEKKAAIHRAIRDLAGMDADRAREINKMGFNKFDNQLGHLLAERDELSDVEAEIGERLIKKYHRQIDAATLETATRREEPTAKDPPAEGSEIDKNLKKSPLESLAQWSAPRQVNTARGPRMVRSAEPDDLFWAAWRKDKDYLKSQGISLSKYQGYWQASWWSDPDAPKYARVRRLVLRYMRDHHPLWYARHKSAAGQLDMFGGAAESAHPRAPVGGTTVGGEQFRGGQFVPGEKVAEAAAQTGKTKEQVAADIQRGKDPVEPFSLERVVEKPKPKPLEVQSLGGQQQVMWRGLKTDMPGQRDFLQEMDEREAQRKRQAAVAPQPAAPPVPAVGTHPETGTPRLAVGGRYHTLVDPAHSREPSLVEITTTPWIEHGGETQRPYQVTNARIIAGPFQGRHLRVSEWDLKPAPAEPQQHAKAADALPGGVGDDADLDEFDPRALAGGMLVEMEHTNDPRLALEIATDHLRERPDYYDRLAEMEAEPLEYGKDPEFERKHPRGQPDNPGQFASSGEGGGEPAPKDAGELPVERPAGAQAPKDLVDLARKQDSGRAGGGGQPHKFANLGDRLEAAPDGATVLGWTKDAGQWTKGDEAIDSAEMLSRAYHPLHKHQMHGELAAIEGAGEAPETGAAVEPEEGVVPEPEMGPEIGAEDEGGDDEWPDFAAEFDPAAFGDEGEEPGPGDEGEAPIEETGEPAGEPEPEAPAPEGEAEPTPVPLPEHLRDEAIGAKLAAAPIGAEIAGWVKTDAPEAGVSVWTRGGDALTDRQFLERYGDPEDRQTILDVLAGRGATPGPARPGNAPTPPAPGGKTPGGAAPQRPISDEDREAAQNVAEMFGIQSGDIANDRRLRLFLNRTARHLGFDPETAGENVMDQAVASAKYLRGQRPQLDAVVAMAKAHGWTASGAQELAARARSAGRHLVRVAERGGYQSTGGEDERADLAGAMEFLSSAETAGPAAEQTDRAKPVHDILSRLLSTASGRITPAHIAGAVLGFWLVYSLMRHRDGGAKSTSPRGPSPVRGKPQTGPIGGPGFGGPRPGI